MADPRIKQPVKIVDGTTDANEAAVTASGDLQVTLAGETVDTELPTAVALADNTANPTAPAVGAHLLVWDSATWDRAPGDSADGLVVNLGANNDVTITGSVDTELPAAAALADAAANPTVPAVGGFMVGFNGTTWDRVRTANTGRLQVDVITGGGSDSPTNPARAHSSSTDTAAGSSTDADSADFGGSTKKLAGVDVGASVPWKAEIKSVDNGSETVLNVLFGKAGESILWRSSHRDYYSVAFSANAGFDGFRVTVTNQDNAKAADLYATLYTED